MDRDEMSKVYRGPSIDASYQVSAHLAEGFQRRRLKCEKLTDNRRHVMAKAHIAFGKVLTRNFDTIFISKKKKTKQNYAVSFSNVFVYHISWSCLLIGPQISANWPRTIRDTVPQLAYSSP
jgi:hypothetical protein